MRMADLAPAEIDAVLDLAAELKSAPRDDYGPRLPGRTLGLLFRQSSTRTRVSLEVAISQLGGTAIQLPPSELQLARGEALGDTARVLSRYLDAIAVRTEAHEELAEIEAHSSIPVLNALTNEEHPLQALADLLTIRERFGGLEGVRVGWVGDGSNVCASLASACRLMGAEFTCATPHGYEPVGVPVVHDPREAASEAHVLVTDVWTSMSHNGNGDRACDLAPFTLDESLLAIADPDAIVLHCLPAHPGEEISPGLLYGPRSAVWDEAENRLHTAKALLALLLA
jgi:ornithine carbamoyltransferase